MNYGLHVLKKNQDSYQEERFRDSKKGTLKHMQHVSRRVEEEKSLAFKEEMKEEEMKEEDLKKEALPLKEREICQKYNAINVINFVTLDTTVLKDQMIEREKRKQHVSRTNFEELPKSPKNENLGNKEFFYLYSYWFCCR